MKRIDLDRAFPETPDCVRASIQLAFQKGARQKMKMRSKTMRMLAAAAALVLLIGVAALAAGRLGAPRPDSVTLGQPVSRTTPTPEPTAEPTVYCTSQGKYYHRYATCSGMEGASATTPSEAQVRGKQPCPVCLPYLDTVYYASDGEYYHVYQACPILMKATAAHLSAGSKAARAQGKQPCPNCLSPYCLDTATDTVYASLDDGVYHLVSDCGGTTDAVPMNYREPLLLGLTPCPNCAENKAEIDGEASNLAAQSDVSEFLVVPTAEDSATVYCTQGGKYYHRDETCSGMRNAQTTTQREAQAMGKFRCQLCNAAEPESYDVFLKVFGHPLSALCPGFEYERSVESADDYHGGNMVEWYVCDGTQEQVACYVFYRKSDGVPRFIHQIYIHLDSMSIPDAFLNAAPNPLRAAWELCRSECDGEVENLAVMMNPDGSIQGGFLDFDEGNPLCTWAVDSNGEVCLTDGTFSIT